MGHVGAKRQDVGGASGGVFQGWNPARYKLYSPSDVIMSDVVVEDVLLVHQLLTVKTYIYNKRFHPTTVFSPGPGPSA